MKSFQNVKGTQDFLPKDQRVRREIVRTLEDLFIQYGCQPLETPILNETSLMASKYAGGDEILEEMYRLSDRGNRDLALRYDLTIPFAKVVAMNPSLSMPFKRYEIGKVFRDGPIKAGRFREFTQCDVDIVGVDTQLAEAELMMMGLEGYRRLNLDVVIQYNNRKLLIGMLNVFGTPRDRVNDVILTLDKLPKIGVDAVVNELEDKEVSPQRVTAIKQFLEEEGNTELSYFERFSESENVLREGIEELRELQSYLMYLGIDEKCVFNPFLARGLDIYTGTIYEVFLRSGSVTSSIGSGGRYDNAVAGLIGRDEPLPTVGISFGLDVIYTAMKEEIEVKESAIEYVIIPINTGVQALKLAKAFRDKGNRVEVDMSGRKVGKAMNKAHREGIPYVIIIGEEEVKNGTYNVKNMATGDENTERFEF